MPTNEELIYSMILDFNVKSQEATSRLQALEKQALGAGAAFDPALVGYVNNADSRLAATSQTVFNLGGNISQAVQIVGNFGQTLGQLHPAFSTLISGAANLAQTAIQGFMAMANAAAPLELRLQGLGGMMANLGQTAATVMIASGTLAAGVETLWNTLKVVAENAGVSFSQAQQMVEGLRDSGITTKEAISSLVHVLAMGLDVGQEKVMQFADAAKNMAVAFGTTGSDALQRFEYFVTTGMVRVVRSIGVMETSVQMEEKYAESLGKTRAELSDKEKQMARMEGLIRAAASYEGAYAQAMQTVGKQLSSMKRLWEEAVLVLGRQFLPILSKLVQGMSGLLKSFTDLEKTNPALLKVVGVLISLTAIVGTLGGALLMLAPSIHSVMLLLGEGGLAATLGGLLGPLGAIVIAVGAVALALYGLKKAFDSLNSSQAARQTAFENEHRALLDTADGADDYAAKMLEAAKAQGQLSTMMGVGTQAAGMAGQAYKTEAQILGELKAQYLAHHSNLNIAQEGYKKLAERLGEATAADKKFGDAQMVVLGSIKQTTKATEEEEAAQVEATKKNREEFAKAWEQSWSSVQSTMDSFYKNAALTRNKEQLEDLRTEAEYKAKRAQAVKEGNQKEVDELDRNYQKMKIMRELDRKLALAEKQKQYAAELKMQMDAWGQKMALWIVEGVSTGKISKANGAAILTALKLTLGEQVTASATASLQLIEIAQQTSDGTIREQNRLIEKSKDLILTYKANAEAAAKAAGAQLLIDFSDQEAAINEAYSRIAEISEDGVSAVGERTQKRAEEVTADIASTLDSLFKSIASIMETLSADLPSLPELTVKKWLDQLYKIGIEVGQWMTSPAQQGLGEWTRWMATDMAPILKDWADAMGIVQSLLDTTRGITDQTSEQLAQTKVAVGQMLDRLLLLTQQTKAWMNAHKADLIGLTRAFKEETTPILSDWVAAMEPLKDILGLAGEATGSLAEELPRTQAKVTTFLQGLLQLTKEARRWVTLNQADLASLVNAFTRETAPLLQRWVAAMEPLRDILGTAADIFGTLAEDTGKAQMSVSEFLSQLKLLSEQAQTWLSANYTPLLGIVAYFLLLRSQVFERWNEALAPLATLMQTASSIFGVLAEETGKAQVGIGEFLDRLKGLSEDVQTWLSVNFMPLQGLVAYFLLLRSGVFERWNEALAPLLALVETGSALFEQLGEEVAEQKISIREFLNRLLEITQELQVGLTARSAELRTATDGLLAHKLLLEEMGAALELVSTALGAASDVLALAAEEAGEVRLSVSQFFDNLIEFTNALTTYLTDNGFELATALMRVNAHRLLLELMAMALEPLSAALSAVQGVLEVATVEVEDVNLAVDQFFDNLIEFTNAVTTYLSENGFELATAVMRVNAHQVLLGLMATALEPLSAALAAIKDVLEIAAVEIADIKLSVSQFFDNLIELTNAITTYLRQNGFELATAVMRVNAHQVLLGFMATALAPLSAALTAIKGVLEVAASEVGLVNLAVGKFFGRLIVFTNSVTTYLSDNGFELATAIMRVSAHKVLLEQMAIALAPLNAALTAIKGVLDLAAGEAGSVNLSVKTFFENVVLVMNATANYLDTSSARVNEAVSKLSRHKTLLENMRKALEPLKAAFDLMIPILEVAAKKAEGVSFAVAWIFDATLKIMNQVETWLTNQGANFAEQMIQFRDEFGPSLDAMRAAITPIAELARSIDDVLNAGQALNPSRVHAVFIGYIRATLLALKDDLNYLKPVMEAMLPLAQSLGEIMTDIREALEISLELIAYGVPEAPATAGYQQGALSEVILSVQTAINGIKAVLTKLVNFLMVEYRGQLASVSFYAEGYAWVQSMVAGVQAGLPELNAALADIAAMLPHSPAEVGPLSAPLDTSYGSEFVVGIARAILGELPTLEYAVGNIPSTVGHVLSSPQALEPLNAAMQMMLDFIGRWAETFTYASAAPLMTTAERIAQVAENIQKALSLLAEISAYRGGNIVVQVQRFVGDLEIVTNALVALDLVDMLARLNEVAAWTEKVGMIAEHLKPAFDLFLALGSYAGTSAAALAGMQAFLSDIRGAMAYLWSLLSQWEIWQWDQFTGWAESAAKVFESMGKTFAMLGKLGEYVGISDVEAKAEQFANDVLVVIGYLYAATQAWGDRALDIAAAWAEESARLVGALVMAFDMLRELDQYVPVADVLAKVQAFTGDLLMVLDELVNAGATMDAEALEAASVWAEGAGKLLSGLKQAFAFLADLAEYAGVPDVAGRIGALAADLQAVFPVLKELGRLFGTEGLEAAAAWAEGAGKLFGAIRSGFDFLRELAEYTPVVDALAKVQSFTAELLATFPYLRDAGVALGTEGLDLAAQWSEGAGKLFGAIRNAFDFLADLAEYVPLADALARVQSFAAELLATFPYLRDAGVALGTEGLDLAVAWANGAGTLFGAIRNAFDFLADLAEYTPVADALAKVRSFAAELLATFPYLRDAGVALGTEGLDLAVAWSDGAGKLFGGIRSAFNFLEGLGEYVPVADVLGKVQAFAADLLATFPYLRDAGVALGTEGLALATAWSEGAGKLFSAIRGAFDFLVDLAAYTPVIDALAKVQEFAADLLETFPYLRDAGVALGVEGLEVAVAWAEGAGRLFGSVRNAFDFLLDLAGYTTVTDVLARVQAFAADLLATFPYLRDAGVALGVEGLDVATAWSEGAGKLFGAIRNAFDFLADLAEYVPVADVLAKVQSFAAELLATFPYLRDAGVALGTEGLDVATLWAEGAGKLFGAIRNAFDFLVGLAEYVPASDVLTKIQAFAGDLLATFPYLRDAGVALGTEGLDVATAWSEGAGKLFGAIRNAFDFLVDLAAYTPGTDTLAKVQSFAAELLATFPYLRDAGVALGVEGLDVATAWSEGAGKLFGAIRNAFDFLVDLAGYAPVADALAKVQSFAAELLATFPYLRDAGVALGVEGLDVAQAWSEGAGKLFGAIRNAFDFLADLTGYAPVIDALSKVQSFAAELLATFPYLHDAGVALGTEGLDLAVAWSEGAGKLFGAIRNAFDFLADLAGYIPVTDALSKVQSFAAGLLATFPYLRDAGVALRVEGLDVATAWSEGAGKLFGAIRNAFDFLVDLAGYAPVADALAKVQSFAAELLATFPYLRDAGVALGVEGLDVAQAWSEGAGKLFGAIRNAFDFLVDLAAYTPVTDALGKVQAFTMELLTTFPYLRDAGMALGGEGLDIATAWAEGAGRLFGTIRNAFDFLADLAGYVPTTDPLGQVQAFAADLLATFPYLRDAGVALGTEGLDVAMAWSEGAGKVFSGISAAFKFLADIGEYVSVANLEVKVRQFADDFETALRGLMGRMGQVQAWFVEQGIKLGQEFADGVKAVVEIAGDALGLLRNLSGVALHVNERQINNFADYLVMLLTALATGIRRAMALGVTAEDLTGLADLGPAFEGLASGLGVLQALVGQAMPDRSQLDRFSELLAYSIGKIATLEISPDQISRLTALQPALDMVNAVLDSFGGFFDRFALGARQGRLPTENTIRGVIDTIRWTIESLMLGPTGLATMMAAHPDWVNVSSWAEALGNAMQTLIGGITAIVSTGATLLAGATGLGGLLAVVDGFIGQISGRSLASWGAGFVQSAADGIRSALPELDAALAEVAARIPASPAEKGPLAALPYNASGDIGGGIVQQIAARVELALPRLDAALAQVGTRFGQPLPGMATQYALAQVGGPRSVTVAPMFNFPNMMIRDEQDQAALARIFSEQLDASLPKIQDAVNRGLGRSTGNRNRY